MSPASGFPEKDGIPVHKSLAEPGIFCKARAMGRMLFSLRYAMPLCAVALLCPDQPSFAQSPPDAKALIGKWELFSVGSHKTTIPREKIEIEDERLRMRDDCNDTFYSYAINDGQITASHGGLPSWAAMKIKLWKKKYLCAFKRQSSLQSLIQRFN
jgi:hypothetical protein